MYTITCHNYGTRIESLHDLTHVHVAGYVYCQRKPIQIVLYIIFFKIVNKLDIIRSIKFDNILLPSCICYCHFIKNHVSYACNKFNGTS